MQYKLISSHQPKTSHYSGYNFVVVEVAACHITQLSAAKSYPRLVTQDPLNKTGKKRSQRSNLCPSRNLCLDRL